MENFLNKCTNVSYSQNSFSKGKHTGTAWKILWQHGACYVCRGVDAMFLGSHERGDRCLVPHLTFWAGPPEEITHKAGYTHPWPSGYRNWLSHTSCSTSLWPPASGRFLTLCSCDYTSLTASTGRTIQSAKST